MDLWLTPADVRTYLGTDQTTGKYADVPLGSNIRAAQGFLERQTGRQFDVQTGVTKTLSSNGAAVVSIPDLRTATSVTLQGATLDADESYWLLPDTRHSGVYVNVQLRAFGSDWRGNPQWFDRNLDHFRHTADTGLPNDLVIVGDWGWTSKPDELLIGVKALAGWLTKRADAVLSGAMQDNAGNVFDYSQWPPEAQAARRLFLRGEQMVSL